MDSYKARLTGRQTPRVSGDERFNVIIKKTSLSVVSVKMQNAH